MESVLRPLGYAEPLRLLETHRARGERVYVVSGSLQEIVEHVATDLGFDGAIGSLCEIVDGRYTGRPLRIALGEEKAVALRELAAREGYDLAACTAYSDSISDLPFLETVGHPVAVNPDPALRRTARARGWPVLEFAELAAPGPPRALPAAAMAVPFVAGVWAAARRRAA
jgi:HAD superfamily hydrolase (TIGR01490 family)